MLVSFHVTLLWLLLFKNKTMFNLRTRRQVVSLPSCFYCQRVREKE